MEDRSKQQSDINRRAVIEALIADSARTGTRRRGECQAVGCRIHANANGYCTFHAYLADDFNPADDDTVELVEDDELRQLRAEMRLARWMRTRGK